MCTSFTVSSPSSALCPEGTANAKGHSIQSPSYTLLHGTGFITLSTQLQAVAFDDPYMPGTCS